ncbi:hypothetical protein pipiens_013489 [Culex pipiens pipiens]|uniref:RNase H type-1 domain-containing protein n=1 Tax=Culex pipiens pipiens TaxID=38569 RepID=A0ABD1CYD2_CULPP
MIDSVTKWLPGWKRNAWKLSTGKPVKNQVDFEELDRELADKSIKIKWNHVDVDCGILGNERADALARKNFRPPLRVCKDSIGRFDATVEQECAHHSFKPTRGEDRGVKKARMNKYFD